MKMRDESRDEADGLARQIKMTDFVFDHPPSFRPYVALMGDDSETNDANGKASSQWTNDCELGRRFDYLIAAGTILSEYWPFN